jgi:hypothetical protein
MGSLPSSRLTRILQEKAEGLKKRRQTAEGVVHDIEQRVKNLESIQITLPETKDRETQLRDLMRRSDWEAVETQARALLEYIEKAAGPAVELRRKDISERGERLRTAGMPIPPETDELLKSLAQTDSTISWGDTVAHLATADGAIVAAETAYSSKIRGQANALLDWIEEPTGRRSELEQKFRAALEPIHRGQVTDALTALNQTLRTELPRAATRRESSRDAGVALVAVARDLGAPSADLEAALFADSENAPLDWIESVTRIESESQKVADSLRDRVVQTVESLRATLESIRDQGFDPTTSLARLREITDQVPEAGPAELPGLLSSARTLTEEPVVAIVASLLDEVRPRLVEARRLGRNPSEVFAAMNRAREALQLKIFSEALAASQEALERVGELTKDLDGARAEAASLQTLLDRLNAAGFPATPYRDPLARSLQLLERVDLEPARALLNDSVRKLGQEAVGHFTRELDTLERIAEISRERGFLPNGLPELLARGRHHLEDGEIAEAGESLAEAEVRLRAAAGPYVTRRVEEIEKGFEEFPEKSLVAPVRLLLADADVHLRVKEDLPASLESLRRAEREFAAIFAAHASALVEGLEEERRALEAMGGTGDEIQRQIDEVQQIFNMGDFVKASKASQEIRTRAHQQMLLRSEEAVSHAKLSLVELGKMGLEAAELRESFEAAQAQAREHKYIEAYQGAIGTERAATKLRNEAQQVSDALEAASGLWQSVKESGIAADAYREDIAKARHEYRSLQFTGAREILARLTTQLERERSAADARRLLAEADLLAQDARRLSVPVDDLSRRWAALSETLSGGEAADHVEAARELQQQFVRLLRPTLEEHLRAIERDLEVARSGGVEVPEVVEKLGDARRRLSAPVPTGVAERLDAARSQLMETRGFLEHAERLVKRARDALSEADLAHADTRALRPRVDQLDQLLSKRQFAQAIELAGGLEREISQATYHHVSKTLAGFQGTITRLRQEGSETTLAENLLRQARTTLEAGHPLEALQLAARSEGEFERVELQMRIAQGSLRAIEENLKETEKDGVLSPSATPIVAAARAALESKRFPAVLERSIEATDMLATSRRAHRRSRDALDSAERQLQEADRFGADTAEAVPVLQSARTQHARGEYAEATERAREAAEKARWSIERVYAMGITQLRGYLETGRKEGLVNELDAIVGPLDETESALKARDWAKATESLAKARTAAYSALDRAVESRLHALDLLEEGSPRSPAEVEASAQARSRIATERGNRAFDGALALVAEELARATDRRRQELEKRLHELKDQVWVGEKLSVDTTPIMELMTEAKQALEGSRFPQVPGIIEKAEKSLGRIVGPRLVDRLRELQTEVVFAQDGLHVLLGPIPEKLGEVEWLRANGKVLDAGRLLLAQEEDLNQRKSMHRELLNLHYLIDAALTRAGERHIDASEPRRLLDESMRARGTDYPAALAKARESLGALQALLKSTDGSPAAAPLWPFRRPPTSP